MVKKQKKTYFFTSFYISIPNFRPVLRSRAARGACAQPELRSDEKHHPGLWTLLRLAPGVGHLSLCIRPPTPGEKDDIDVSVVFIGIHLSCSFPTQPEERPPLLHSWRAHHATLLSVEVLEVADRLFVLSASSDGSTSVWTNDGDHVGRFSQEAAWNISEPATYQR